MRDSSLVEVIRRSPMLRGTIKVSLEISLDSVESAVAAEEGGADRVELCAELTLGGTTPPDILIQTVRRNIEIDLFVMIRPRGGDYLYDQVEFEAMKRDIVTAKRLGADGVVVGLLTRSGNVDRIRMEELVRSARPMRVMFHRAFDETRDPYESLEEIINAGADRLLTSGQHSTAYAGARLIHELRQRTSERIAIIAAAGIHAKNVGALLTSIGVREVHVGRGVMKQKERGANVVDVELVRQMVQLLHDH